MRLQLAFRYQSFSQSEEFGGKLVVLWVGRDGVTQDCELLAERGVSEGRQMFNVLAARVQGRNGP